MLDFTNFLEVGEDVGSIFNFFNKTPDQNKHVNTIKMI